MRRAAAEIARALRDHHERHSEQRAHHQPVIGVVESIGGGTPGFSVSIPDSGFVLDADDLIVGQQVAQFDQDYGIHVGDSLSLMPLANGDYVAVAVHTSTDATKRKTSPGTNATSGLPAAGVGQDGDFALDPATGNVYGPKAAGVWPSTPISLIGPAGPTGPTGATGGTGPTGATGATGPAGAALIVGVGAPSAGTGVNGDTYLDRISMLIYSPKAGGSWPAGVTFGIHPFILLGS